MPSLKNPLIALKALRQLGLQPVALNALYRFGLVTGHYRRATERLAAIPSPTACQPLFALPAREQILSVIGPDGLQALLAEADEIAAGRVRLFGAEPVELRLAPEVPLSDWTAYESGRVKIEGDVKFVWEPARFGWAFTLGRAYHLGGDEKYARAFWEYFETFAAANPPCRGPNWASGQEVALRLMAFAWASQVFATAPASTPERQARLAASLAAHAARLPPTLVYARSQNNNHLLSEAAGLLTAGLALPEHPQASRWRALGWRWLNEGLQAQVDSYGEYAQHSSNYQRLMLQLMLWSNALVRRHDLRWPRQTLEALGRATHWLLAILDYETGRTPNLGANDGAYIFPLTVCPFADYRPALHAAARAFLDYDLGHGPWDELALWFGLALENPKAMQLPRYLGDQVYGKNSWAYLRTAQFTSRPSHADQLHLDLWWRGLNVARDAGTYLYNADPPWDNRLTAAQVHNTLTVDGRDQFTRAGRFLYLDWFNAYRRPALDPDPQALQRLRGRHWGYMNRGVRHTRTVTAFVDDRWRVEDELLLLRLPWQRKPLAFRLHWLLPDWTWEIGTSAGKIELRLDSPHGPVRLVLHTEPPLPDLQVSLVRAGEIVYGAAKPDPVRGWVSPTYGVRLPALSLALEARTPDAVQFTSEFLFP